MEIIEARVEPDREFMSQVEYIIDDSIDAFLVRITKKNLRSMSLNIFYTKAHQTH